MARKIIVNTADAIGSMVGKVNQMSNYLGDLDDLDSHFGLSQLVDSPDVGHYDDSSFVKAINHLHYELDSIDGYLTSGTANITVNSITGDSARFTRLTVGSLIVDSAQIDSAFVGLLRGNYLNYDNAEFDSARITNLSGRNLNFDSADIITLRSEETFGDSARITSISGSGTLNYAVGHFGTMDADSIGFINASIENLTANVVTVNDTLTYDGFDMIDAKLFTIKDSVGTNLLAGYLFSTSTTLGIA
jgi:hypothetical protein